jgi:hypothetical protein
MLTAVFVKLFGRLHDDPIHTRQRQAFEKHQWTKSREVGRLRCSGLCDGLIGAPTLMRTEATARNEVDGAFKRVTPSPSWNQQAAHTTRACWYGS